ncbi:MAG: DUF885 domain-containing protein [Eubacteriales bacterium]
MLLFKKTTTILLLILTLAMTTIGCDNIDNNGTINESTTSNDNKELDNNGTINESVTPNDNKENTLFNEFMDETFVKELESSSMNIETYLLHPENYGLEDVEIKLPNISEESFNEDIKAINSYLDKLNEFDYFKLSKDNQLNYDIIKHYLQTSLDTTESYLYNEYASPSLGFQTNLPLSLAEYRLESQKDIEDYLGLIKDFPTFIDQIIEFQEAKAAEGLLMSTSSIERVIDQCNVFIEDPENNLLIASFNERIEKLEDFDSEEAEEYIDKNKKLVLNEVIPSYEKFIEAFENLNGKTENEMGLYYFDNGKEYYESIAKFYTGSSRSVEGMIKFIDTKMQSYITEISTIATSDQSVLEEVMSFTYDGTPESIIETLKSELYNDYPMIEEPELNITPVPKSLEESYFPASYSLPTIDADTTNIIKINYHEDFNLEQLLYTNLAHEGYPGHLYQFNYAIQLDLPEIRHLLDYRGYSEGWAVNAEQHAINYLDKSDNFKRFMQVSPMLDYLLAGRINIGIHYEGWTLEDTEEYINSYVPGLEVEPIYEDAVSEPGFILCYAIGYLEMAELRENAQKALGENFDYKEFHRFILDIGPAPYGIINEQFELWLDEQLSDIELDEAA